MGKVYLWLTRSCRAEQKGLHWDSYGAAALYRRVVAVVCYMPAVAAATAEFAESAAAEAWHLMMAPARRDLQVRRLCLRVRQGLLYLMTARYRRNQ